MIFIILVLRGGGEVALGSTACAGIVPAIPELGGAPARQLGAAMVPAITIARLVLNLSSPEIVCQQV